MLQLVKSLANTSEVKQVDLVTRLINDSKVDIVDIMLVLDMSSSMLAEDFKPNRLEASKEVAKTFIKDRSGDRLGIIIFAGQSFIQCPLTIDSDVLVEFVDKIEVAQEDNDGTAIGMAIANATNRLRFSDSKNKIMILSGGAIGFICFCGFIFIYNAYNCYCRITKKI